MLLNGVPLGESLCKCLGTNSHWFNFQLIQRLYSLNISWNGFYANRVCFTTDFHKSIIRQFRINEAFLQYKNPQTCCKCRQKKIWHSGWHLYNSGLTHFTLVIEAAFSRRHIVLRPSHHVRIPTWAWPQPASRYPLKFFTTISFSKCTYFLYLHEILNLYTLKHR